MNKNGMRYNWATLQWEDDQPLPSSLQEPFSITLVNGVTLSGPITEVVKQAELLGHSLEKEKMGIYWSDTKKQYIRIKDMPIPYTRNAFLKRLNKKLTTLLTEAKTHNDKEFIKLFHDPKYSLIDNDPILFELLKHLNDEVNG